MNLPCEDGVYREDWRAVMGPDDGCGYDGVDDNPRSAMLEARRANGRRKRRGAFERERGCAHIGPFGSKVKK